MVVEMKEGISSILGKLSSKSVLERKEAIRRLRQRLSGEDSYMARLALHYVSIHDPCYTVRNIARQAFYRISEPPDSEGCWEKAYLFQKE
jgi:hypothetical protein